MNVNPEQRSASREVMPHRPQERLAAGDSWMQSREVAKRLGIRTQTLAKWRLTGKGPRGWKRVAPNLVLYPASALANFEEEIGLVYSKAN